MFPQVKFPAWSDRAAQTGRQALGEMLSFPFFHLGLSSPKSIAGLNHACPTCCPAGARGGGLGRKYLEFPSSLKVSLCFTHSVEQSELTRPKSVACAYSGICLASKYIFLSPEETPTLSQTYFVGHQQVCHGQEDKARPWSLTMARTRSTRGPCPWPGGQGPPVVPAGDLDLHSATLFAKFHDFCGIQVLAEY